MEEYTCSRAVRRHTRDRDGPGDLDQFGRPLSLRLVRHPDIANRVLTDTLHVV